MDYTEPITFATGQVVGRIHLDVLRDNDDFFNAVADRYNPVPAGMVTDWEGDTTNRIAWDGWHLKRTDMDTLYYHAELDNDDGGHPTTLNGYYDYNNDHSQTLMFTRNTDGTSSGTVDLSGFPNGLYRVLFTMSRGGGDISYDATVKIRAPYTIYTGSESYTVGDTITDGNVSAATTFNKWRTNDVYFNAITPSRVASAGMMRYLSLATTEYEIFNGWDKFHPDHMRMYYRCWLDEQYPADTSEIYIYYDADDDVGIQSTSFSTADWTESHWDFADNGYVKGDWYRVRVTLKTGAGTGYRYGGMDYLYITAASLDASYTVMDPFTVGQFVYGDTVGEDTRLQLLTDNDASIYDRLTWGAANPGRMDFACFEPEFKVNNGDYKYGNFGFQRQGDMLYYRTTGAELVLPDGSTEGLDDHDGNSGDYNTLNLNSLNLPYGALYQIRRASYTSQEELADYNNAQITDETLEFAMEI